MKSWEILADNLKKAGWSWGCVSAVDSCGRMIWIVDAHRDDGKRFVVHADEKLTAFVELESVIHSRAANCLDKLARFSADLASLNGSEIRWRTFSRQALRLFRTRQSQNQPKESRIILRTRSLNDCGEPGIKRGLTQRVFMN